MTVKAVLRKELASQERRWTSSPWKSRIWPRSNRKQYSRSCSVHRYQITSNKTKTNTAAVRSVPTAIRAWPTTHPTRTIQTITRQMAMPTRMHRTPMPTPTQPPVPPTINSLIKTPQGLPRQQKQPRIKHLLQRLSQRRQAPRTKRRGIGKRKSKEKPETTKTVQESKRTEKATTTATKRTQTAKEPIIKKESASAGPVTLKMKRSKKK